MYIYIYVGVCIQKYICVCVYIYICMYVNIYTCMDRGCIQDSTGLVNFSRWGWCKATCG